MELSSNDLSRSLSFHFSGDTLHVIPSMFLVGFYELLEISPVPISETLMKKFFFFCDLVFRQSFSLVDLFLLSFLPGIQLLRAQVGIFWNLQMRKVGIRESGFWNNLQPWTLWELD